MGERDAFTCAICSEPEEDAHRLVYADWLEENGEPDRANFIRLQIELARIQVDQDARAIGISTARRETEALRDSLAVMFRQNAPLWFAHLPGSWRTTIEGYTEIQTAEGWNYLVTRGFVSWVSMGSISFLENAEGLFAREPITRAKLEHKRPAETADGWVWVRVEGARELETDALPPELFDLLPVASPMGDELAEECRGYPLVYSQDGTERPVTLLYLTPTRAETALQRILIPFGRSRAHLPSLVESRPNA